MRRLLDIGIVSLACVALAACSDDPISDAGRTPWKGGTTAYLRVSINSASDATRGEDGGRTDGVITHNDGRTCNESKITNARFFFYDELGEYVTEGVITDSIAGTKPADQDNIEKQTSEVVALDGVTYCPAYVVTMLNVPTDFNAPATLNDFYNLKISDVTSGTTPEAWADRNSGDERVFPMMTSTYINGENYPFVTRIDPNSFKESSEDLVSTDPVDIYVERLQAKLTVSNDIASDDAVAMSLSNSAVSSEVEGSDDTIYFNVYPLDSSIKINVPNGSYATKVDDTLQLYAGIIGYNITATTPNSYMLKQIDQNWTQASLGFDWTSSLCYRTFWGKSYNYGDASAVYPDHYTTDMNAELTYQPFTSGNRRVTFNYFDNDVYNINTDGELTYNPAEYAFENTNSSAILSKHYPSAMTAALIKAKLFVKQDDTFYETELIKFNDQFYTTDAYKIFVWNKLYYDYRLLYYYIAPEATTKKSIRPAMLQISDADYLNGRVIVQLAPEYTTTGTWVNGAGEKVTIDEINKALADFNSVNEAIGYREGDMYYYVPIEHLNTANNTSNNWGQVTNVPEGKYGFVRNHWYQLSITELTKPGHGVWEPDEPIVPDPNDNLYTLSARINVLAWKVVKFNAYL